MKRFLIVLLLAVSLTVPLLFRVPQAHAQSKRPALPVGWCSSEGCDAGLQNDRSANCSTFQIIKTQQTLHDAGGRAFATGYIFESQNTNNGVPCYAAWGALSLNSGFSMSSPGTWIGTLNTKVYQGGQETGVGCGPHDNFCWLSTDMLSDVDESGTCVSAWLNGVDFQSGVGQIFNLKLIGGGAGC